MARFPKAQYPVHPPAPEPRGEGATSDYAEERFGAAAPIPPSMVRDAAEPYSAGGNSEELREKLLKTFSGVAYRLVRELDESTLRRVMREPSEDSVVLRALEAAPLEHSDPLRPARLRGLQAARALLNREGGTLTAEEVAKHLGVTRQAVDKKRHAGKLLAVTRGSRSVLYPAWQFTPQGILPGLEAVLRALDENKTDPWAKLSFFLGENLRLGGDSPLTALRAGRVEEVIVAARSFGEHGAA
jgi:hypothetical protein